MNVQCFAKSNDNWLVVDMGLIVELGDMNSI